MDCMCGMAEQRVRQSDFWGHSMMYSMLAMRIQCLLFRSV